MESILLLCAVVIVICIVASRLSQRLGVPALLLFLALGMLFGSDGLFRIPFDNFEAAERICSVALIFIMFYGGFGTRWEAARPAAARAVVLSTLGVAVTALLTALFCHLALGFSALESFLTGAVISSTDAASVFSILRSKKLGLRNHTASLLEVESGSNDPASYMLTVIALSLMGVGGGGAIPWMIFAQVVFGLGLGAAVAAVHSGAPQAHSLRRAGYYFRGGCGPALLCPARRGGGERLPGGLSGGHPDRKRQNSP